MTRAHNTSSFSRRLLMTSTAMVAAGTMAFTPINAQADNAWVLNQEGGSFDTDTSVDNITNIQQNTDRAYGVGDLDIKEYQAVNINQNNSGSLFVARDNKNDPTQILGALNANGQVMVLDRNGVFFGNQAQIDVGSIIASTGDVDVDAIMNGANVMEFTNLGDAAIENRGQISVAEAGIAAFVAPTVKNSGVINARLGKVAFAAGEKVTLDLYGDKLVEIAADEELEDALIENAGTINAQGGTVQMTARAAKDAVDNVINMEGVINASSVTQKGGKIILDGGDSGVVKVSGTVDASGAEGGEVEIDGENTYLTADSKVDVSSTDKENGQGGRAVLWGRENAIYAGEIDARGKNGFVETSGGNLGVWGDVLVGVGTEWLLDPTDIYIVGTSNLDDSDVDLSSVFAPEDPDTTPDVDSDIDGLGNEDSVFWVWDELINAALDAGGNVTLQTGAEGTNEGDITLRADAAIEKSSGPESKLILEAHDDIIIDGTITGTGGDTFDVYLIADITEANTGAEIVINNTIDIAGNNGNLLMAAAGNVNINSETYSEVANFLTPTANLAANVNANVISGVASTVNVLNDSAEIQDGVDAGGTGAEIFVSAGTFDESVNTYKDGQSLYGANAGTAGNDARGGPESIVTPNSPGFHVTGNGVTIDGFEISGGNIGIHVDGADDVTLENNIVHGQRHPAAQGDNVGFQGSGDGILVNGHSDNTLITRNYVYDTDDEAIQAYQASNIVVDDNELDNSEVGASDGIGNGNIAVAFDNVTGESVITNNLITSGFDAGVEVKASSGVTVGGSVGDGNEINGQGNTDQGVYVKSGSTGIEVSYNTIDNAGANGVYNNNSNGTIIANNTITNAGENGVLVNPSSNVSVTNNFIDSTGSHGVNVLGGSNNTVSDNEIGLNDGDDNINGDGIHVDGSDNFTAQGNEITNTTSTDFDIGNGIQVLNSAGATIGGLAEGEGNVIYNTEWDGIRLEFVTDSEVVGNDVEDAQRVGIYGRDVSVLEISENDVDGTNEFEGIGVFRGSDITISENNVDNTDTDGIQARSISSGLLIEDNIIGLDGADDSIGDNGIEVRDSGAPVISSNNIANTANNGIYVSNSNGAFVSGNTITNAGANGVLVNPSDDVEVYGNTVMYTDLDGIRVEGGTGILIEQNMVMNAGVDGIHVLDHKGENFGHADIVNNIVVHTGDDGIEVENGESVNIDRNTVGHIKNDSWDADGIRTVDVEHSVIKWNGVADVDDDGIRVKGGSYAGIFGNHVIMTGDEGIEVSDIYGYSDLPADAAAADVDYPATGYAVSIEENEVVLTGDNGIYVHDSENTRISGNDVLMAGIAGEEISEVPTFAALVSEGEGSEESFTMNWGNGDGIKVENVGKERVITTALPAGEVSVDDDYDYGTWGVLIQGNDVAWTGGDGIDVNGAGSTLIGGNSESEANTVYQAGIESTTIQGYDSYEDLTMSGPFADVEERHTVWWGEAWPYSGAALDDLTDEVGGHLTGNIMYATHDTHDGIVATNIYKTSYGYIPPAEGEGEGEPEIPSGGGAGNAGSTGDFYYGYALNIIGNDVNTTGDDGIEAGWSSSALIQDNTVMGAGIGTVYGTDLEEVGEDYRVNYGAGDYNGADGINAYGIYGERSLSAGSYGENYEEYALVIDGNFVNGAADDGIEVADAGRTKIVGNNIMNVGIYGGGYNGGLIYLSAYSDGGATAGDGYGADGIHARNVSDHTYSYDDDGSYTYGNGTGLEISNNVVARTGDDGIEVVGGYGRRALVSELSGDGYGAEGLRVVIDDNQVTEAGYGDDSYYGAADGWGADGIHVRDVIANGYSETYDSETDESTYKNLYNTGTSVTISNNFVDTTADDGIQVLDSGNSVIDNNQVYNAGYGVPSEGGDGVEYGGEGYLDGNGADGIHVEMSAPGDDEYYPEVPTVLSVSASSSEVPYFLSTSTEITNNVVDTANDDGIDVEGVTDVLVANNDVDNVGDDGIEVVGYFGGFESGPDVFLFDEEVVEVGTDTDTLPEFTATISNNTVDNADDNGIVVEDLDTFFIDNNTINNTGLDPETDGDGIQAIFYGNGQITNNTISNANGDGIFADGYNDAGVGYSILIDNNDINDVSDDGMDINYTDLVTITNNEVTNADDVGILVDYANGDVFFTGNTMTNNTIGAAFNSGIVNMIGDANTFTGGEIGLQFNGPEVELTDNNPLDDFEGSLGTSVFDGQSELFVELTNNALFGPGPGPYIYDASQGTYQNFAGTLEDMFFHFVDDNSLGLFFFGGLENQEDIFNTFGTFNGNTTGARMTITGLPTINQQQTAELLNNLTPAAGGEGEPTAEELAGINPAAGGENVGCWSDAINVADAGGTVNYDFDTSFESALADTANCGSDTEQ